MSENKVFITASDKVVFNKPVFHINGKPVILAVSLMRAVAEEITSHFDHSEEPTQLGMLEDIAKALNILYSSATPLELSDEAYETSSPERMRLLPTLKLGIYGGINFTVTPQVFTDMILLVPDFIRSSFVSTKEDFNTTSNKLYIHRLMCDGCLAFEDGKWNVEPVVPKPLADIRTKLKEITSDWGVTVLDGKTLSFKYRGFTGIKQAGFMKPTTVNAGFRKEVIDGEEVYVINRECAAVNLYHPRLDGAVEVLATAMRIVDMLGIDYKKESEENA